MRVIGWTNWHDPRYLQDDLSDPLFEERWQTAIEELRRHNYHMDGFYHQDGELGVPVFDDGGWLRVSYRTWGQLMAEAYPQEVGHHPMAYVEWAWTWSGEKDREVLPQREDYPDYDFWNGVADSEGNSDREN